MVRREWQRARRSLRHASHIQWRVGYNQPIYTLKNGVYTPIPIDVTSGQTYLILFGTGLRNGAGFQASSSGQNNGKALYAGPQPSFPGLDQVNVLLPSTLAGSGCISLLISAEALASNTVFVCIQ